MTVSANPGLSDDEFLLQQVALGDRQSFGLLFGKYWAPAYSAAYKRLKDEDQCKDIVQEIFTHIWQKRETLRIHNFPAYLNIAVRNQVFKTAARLKRTQPFFRILEHLPEQKLQADGDLLRKEFYQAYEELIASFPPQRQIIFRMRFQNELPTGDIARELGLSRKTVQNQLGKAIEKLRVSLLHFFVLLLASLYALL